MIVRRLASRRLVKRGSTEEEPRRKRARRFLVLVLASGILAGTAAALGIWPFGSFTTLYAKLVPPDRAPQAPASAIFPAVQPVHKTVDVYASPKPRAPVSTGQPTSTAAPPGPTQPPEPGDT